MANTITAYRGSNGERLIAEIQKNATSRVRVSLTYYRGRQCVDVRLWSTGQNHDYHPPRQGVTLRPDQVASVLQGLQIAGRLTAEVLG